MSDVATKQAEPATEPDMMTMFREEEAKQPSTAEPQHTASDDGTPPPAKPKENEGKVSVAERVALRKERAELRKEKEAFAVQRAEVDRLKAELQAGVTNNVRKLVDDGDFEGAAKALNFESWNKLNEYVARFYASPEFKRVRALEEQAERDRKERAESERQTKERQAQEERAAVEQRAMTEIREVLAASEDAAVKALNADEYFAVMVYKELDAHYQRTGEVMDLSEAAQALVARARDRYSRYYVAAFGGQPTQQAETRSRVPQDRAGSKEQPERRTTKHVSTNTAAEASSAVEPEMTDEEFRAWATERVRDAWKSSTA